MHLRVTLLGLFSFLLPNFVHAQGKAFDQEIQEQLLHSKVLMLENISRSDAAKGSVVAAPSKHDPEYYYHWIRDAALTMRSVSSLYAQASGSIKDSYRQYLFDYVTFSRGNQMTPNRSGGLGEPKFNVDGSAYTGDWGRPQNDGPALRAITLTQFALQLLKEGGHDDYVRTTLYDGRIPTNSVIKSDLEYTAYHWKELSFDLWEEVYGHHFFTLMMQRRALVDGAKLADNLGDGGAADYYRQQVTLMEQRLLQFWNGQQILATLDQDSQNTKPSGLDTAVILAAIYGDTGNGFFSPSSDRVMATAFQLIKSFMQIYAINHNTHVGPAIGRYPEDVYNGNGSSLGNPWFLTTTAFAELSNRIRSEYDHVGAIYVTILNKPFLDFALAGTGTVSLGSVIDRKTPQFAQILNQLSATADRFLNCVLLHKAADGSLSEEFNRDSGFMQGAPNLTWSHASFLSAVEWRPSSFQSSSTTTTE